LTEERRCWILDDGLWTGLWITDSGPDSRTGNWIEMLDRDAGFRRDVLYAMLERCFLRKA